jgi:hypothetical protein
MIEATIQKLEELAEKVQKSGDILGGLTELDKSLIENIGKLSEQFTQYKKEIIKWGVEDVLHQAEIIGYFISNAQAQEVLEEVIDNHDSSYGIGWDTFSHYIQDTGVEVDPDAEYFEIDGYWKDDKSQFTDYLVCVYDGSEELDEEDDTEVFFFGLSEKEIQEAINLGEDTVHDFVITSYLPVKKKEVSNA